MTNKKRGEVKLEIGGRDRVLRLTLNDFACLQDRFDNKPLMDILGTLDKLDVKVMRAMLYYALRHDDKDLTEEQIGEFEMNFTVTVAKLSECIAVCLGGGESSEKK